MNASLDVLVWRNASLWLKTILYAVQSFLKNNKNIYNVVFYNLNQLKTTYDLSLLKKKKKKKEKHEMT